VRLLAVAVLAVAAALAAGCIHVSVQAPPAPSPLPPAAAPGTYRVACLVVDENRTPLPAGTCGFRFGALGADVPVDRNGTAARSVPAGLSGTLTAAAPGHASLQARLTVDGPKSVRFPLPRLAPGATASTLTTSVGAGGPANATDPSLPTVVLPKPRPWRGAVPVVADLSGGEPQVAVAPDGTVYYSPLSAVYRSTDGGHTFEDVTPNPPVHSASDTAIQVAPDGSVWFADDWPYAGPTQACGSTDRGTTWTCDLAAIPGATDRMWVAGASAQVAYVMTNEGLEYHTFAKTTDGGHTFTPYAAEVLDTTTRNGNMVVDQVHDAVWEVESSGGTLRLLRIDGAGPTIAKLDTPVPAPYSLPWLAASNGTLWTSGEKDGRILVARSTDQGRTWATFPVSIAPKMATFGAVAANPDGRAVVVYYGSDQPGAPDDNHGHWSLYVAETDNGLAPQPTWVETRVVDAIHDGNLCIGLNCEQSGGDAQARMAGDLIGAALDRDGNAYLAYIQQVGNAFPNLMLRQG